MRSYYTYILANRKGGTIYTGMTNDLIRRAIEHKSKKIPGFTRKYGITELVWFEEFEWVHDAIARERQIKGWKRDKKIALIESLNPQWKDLFHTLW